MLVAATSLRWGDDWLAPGDRVPEGEPGRNYAAMVRLGQVVEVPQSAQPEGAERTGDPPEPPAKPGADVTPDDQSAVPSEAPSDEPEPEPEPVDSELKAEVDPEPVEEKPAAKPRRARTSSAKANTKAKASTRAKRGTSKK